MKKFIGVGILSTSLLIDCQFENIEDVVENQGGGFKNEEYFETFVESIEAGTSDQLDYIRYGEEGEEIVTKLRFDGTEIDVGTYLGWRTIEKFTCASAEQQGIEESISFYLKDCTGDVTGHLELASYPLPSEED
ncbi:DUF4362 domain-containing protein [Chryseomicrobium sp. FSL W7-1435]|uniref:DUF4362 domain-containing protein n=1 Tax=Chryseomicrobium sp. FSL W7-1435 TaxID=2921704 RepID=UPI00315ACC50